MFETPAYAAAGASGSSFFIQLFPFILIIAVFYFLLIRPQQKRLKEHRDMVAGLRRGDVVVTSGGLIGKIHRVGDDDVTVELAENIRVKAVRATISEVRSKTEPAPANDSGKDQA